MIFQNQKNRKLWVTGVFVLIIGLACDLPIPQPESPTATTAPLTEQTPVPDVTGEVVTPSSSDDAILAPGTILLDQTSSISTGTSVEFSFEGPKEQVIIIDVTLVSGKPAYQFHLVDKFGNFVAVFDSDPSLITEQVPEFTLPYTGTYKILLTSISGDGTLEVSVSAGDKSSGGGTLSNLGSSINGLTSAPHYYHTYFVQLTQGQVVTLSAKASVNGTPDTNLVVFGPDGQYVNDADDVSLPNDFNAVLSGYVVPTTGTYIVIVNNKGGAIGAYNFSATLDTNAPEAEGAPSIVYDTDYPLGLFEGSNADVTFDGTIGDVVRIGVTGMASTVSVDIYLYSPFDQTIAYVVTTEKGRDALIAEAQLPYTGRYRLQVRPTGDGQGVLRVSHLTAVELSGGGGFGGNARESLPGRITQPNTFHYYQFSAKAGDKVSLAIYSVSSSGSLDMGFAVLGPNGRQLVFADDSDSEFPKDPELKDYLIMHTGTFTVIVYSFTPATGTYDFELIRN